MELVAVFLLLVVLILIVFFISLPFFDRHRTRVAGNDQEFSSLLAERERLLTALQELEFDQSLGKIPSEDYPLQRSELLHKGAEVLRELDAISSRSPKQLGGILKSSDNKLKVNESLSDDDMEALLAKRRIIRKEKTAGFCPHCGKPVLQSDVFCSSCGNTLGK